MLIARPVQQRQRLVSLSRCGGYHREGGRLDVFPLGASDELVSHRPRLVWFARIRIDNRLARRPPWVSARDRGRPPVYGPSVLQSPRPVRPPPNWGPRPARGPARRTAARRPAPAVAHRAD